MNFTNNLYHRCLLWVFELENPKGLHVTLARTGVRLQGLCAGGMQRRGRDISAPAIGRMLLLLISYRLPFSSHLFLMLFLPESDSAAFRCVCACQVTSVMSDSVQPHGPRPTRLLCPWDSPGQTGRPCPPPGHFLLPGIKPVSLKSHTLASRFFTTRATGTGRQLDTEGYPRPDKVGKIWRQWNKTVTEVSRLAWKTLAGEVKKGLWESSKSDDRREE